MNFDYRIKDVSVDDILESTLNGLANKFVAGDLDNDEMKLNITQKTYTLIKSTKLAIIKYPIDMIDIIHTFLNLINDWYYGNNYIGNYNKFYIDAFESWVTESQNKPSGKQDNYTEYITRPVFSLDTNSKMIWLDVPSISLKNVSE